MLIVRRSFSLLNKRGGPVVPLALLIYMMLGPTTGAGAPPAPGEWLSTRGDTLHDSAGSTTAFASPVVALVEPSPPPGSLFLTTERADPPSGAGGTGQPIPPTDNITALHDRPIPSGISAEPGTITHSHSHSHSHPHPHSHSYSPPDDITSIGNPFGEALAAAEEARAVISKLKQTGQFLQRLTGGDLIKLPVGLQQRIGNITYTMGIGAMRLLPTHAEVDVFLEIDLPDREQDPIFGAKGVKFTRRGGFVGDVQLALLGDFPIDLRRKKSRIVLRAGHGPAGGTYVTVGCDGFQELSVDAFLIFSRDWLLPVNAQGRIDTTSSRRVSGSFSFRAKSWDFVVTLADFSPFAVKGLEDVTWKVRQLSLDFSDLENPGNLTFPDNYHSPFVTGGKALPLWKGVYLREVAVTLPSQFSPRDGPPPTLVAHDLIIDDQGLTGRLGLYNPLPLDQGDLDGWAFSVDTFRVRLLAMQLEEASLAGLINVPLLSAASTNRPESIGPEDCLRYRALIQPAGRYDFSVIAGSNYRADMWKAAVTIAANSRIDLSYQREKFTATATLHGTLAIKDDFGTNIKMDVGEISFDSLRLANHPPYLQTGTWTFPARGGARFGAFELGFSNIAMREGEQPNEPELHLAALIGLDTDQFDLAAAGGFRIVGQLVEVGGRQRWRFKDFKVDALSIDASTEAWGVSAALAFYKKDEVYGTGFYGQGKLWFSALGGRGFGVEAVAQFGTTEGEAAFRYFYVDVMTRLGNGLPIVPGLNLVGLGGGVYKRMRPQGQVTEIDPTSGQVVAVVGSSVSGVIYRPAADQVFGVKLAVVVATPGADIFSVNGAFSLEINASNGFKAGITGNVVFFGPINWNSTLPHNPSGINVFVDMAYRRDAAYTGFTACAEVYVNIQGGIVGNSGEKGYAGGVQMEFSNQRWFVNIGTPETPLSLKAKAILAQAVVSAYADFGQNIPPMPPLPDYVQSLTGAGNFMRNESMFASGMGVAFGASMQVEAKKKPWPFYYELGVGFGFDLMLQNYGEAVCAESGAGLGINGWYASGQAWAYLSGEVGISVNLWFAKGDFPILAASAAAVLQAKGPNPFWGKGYVGGKYNILGGLVKGSFRLSVEIGQQCVMTNGEDPLTNLQLIMNTVPAEGSKDVEVLAKATALTNLPLDETFELDGQRYRLITKEARLLAGDKALPAEMIYQAGDNYFDLVPSEALPGETAITFSVSVALYREAGDGSVGEMIKTENQPITFTTQPSPDHIPLDNIAFAYPALGQYNLYREEYPQAHIQLRTGQADLLRRPPSGLQAQVRLTAADGQVLRQSFQYHEAKRRIEFDLPTADLLLDRVYRLELLYTAPSADVGPGMGGAERGPSAPAELLVTSVPDDQVLLVYYFRTSRYASLGDKLAGFGTVSVNENLWSVLSATEPFDALEVEGAEDCPALLLLEAGTDFPWFRRNKFQEQVYAHFPNEDMPISWRDPDFGHVPTLGVSLRQAMPPPAIDEAAFVNGGATPGGAYSDTLHYSFPQLAVADFSNFKTDARAFYRYAWEAICQEIYNQTTLPPPSENVIIFGPYRRLDLNRDGYVDGTEIDSALMEDCHDPDYCSGNYLSRCLNGGAFHCPISGAWRAIRNAPNPSTLTIQPGERLPLKISYRLPGTAEITNTYTFSLNY